MSDAVIERMEGKNKDIKTRRFGLALAVLAVLYIGAVIAFIIVY
jgi:hypothetical protein